MRTTLEIDDDLLQAAKDLARQQKITAGQVVSSLLRQALTQGHSPQDTQSINSSTPFISLSSFHCDGVAVSE